MLGCKRLHEICMAVRNCYELYFHRVAYCPKVLVPASLRFFPVVDILLKIGRSSVIFGYISIFCSKQIFSGLISRQVSSNGASIIFVFVTRCLCSKRLGTEYLRTESLFVGLESILDNRENRLPILLRGFLELKLLRLLCWECCSTNLANLKDQKQIS